MVTADDSQPYLSANPGKATSGLPSPSLVQVVTRENKTKGVQQKREIKHDFGCILLFILWNLSFWD